MTTTTRPTMTIVAPHAKPHVPPRSLRRILCLEVFEAGARSHLPRPLFGYIAGAAETNQSFESNRQAFADYRFVPRVMVDISRRSTATSLFDRE